MSLDGFATAQLAKDRGESMPSNGAAVSLSGISDLRSEGIAIYVEGHEIVVSGADGRDISVFSADGMRLADVRGDAVNRIRVSTGVYLVKVSGHTVKVIVR